MPTYDKWLEQPYQEFADEMDAMEARVGRLMEGECNPEDATNFLQAVADECLEASKAEIAGAIQTGKTDFEVLGKVVWEAVYRYWEDQAMKQTKI